MSESSRSIYKKFSAMEYSFSRVMEYQTLTVKIVHLADILVADDRRHLRYEIYAFDQRFVLVNVIRLIVIIV